MGRARIVDNLGEGRYRIAIMREVARLQRQIDKLAAEVVWLTEQLADLTGKIYNANLELAAAIHAFDLAVEAMEVPPTEEQSAAMQEAQTRLQKAQQAYAALKNQQVQYRLRKVAVEKRKGELEGVVPTDEVVEAWCADYSLALAGEVGTIEPVRADATLPIIYPDGDGLGHAAWTPARDGEGQAVLAGTPASNLLNYMLLPGMDKWRPRYRKGRITALDGNLATVALDTVLSGHQRLLVNQSAELTAPIDYMNCDEDVFLVGDRVVVAFTGDDWNQPKVIGFESNPRPCTLTGFALAAGGNVWGLRRTAGQWGARVPLQVPVYGGIDWRGQDGEVLSFAGTSRYCDTSFVATPAVTLNTFGPNIFHRGEVLLTVAAGVILGAALAGGKLLYVVGDEGGGGYVATEKFYFADLTDLASPRLAETLTWTGVTTPGFNLVPWLFASDGLAGTTVRSQTGEMYYRRRVAIDAGSETVTMTSYGAAFYGVQDNDYSYSETPDIPDSGGPETGTVTGSGTISLVRRQTWLIEDYLGTTLLQGSVVDEQAVTYATDWTATFYDHGSSLNPDQAGTVNKTILHTLTLERGGVTIAQVVLGDLAASNAFQRLGSISISRYANEMTIDAAVTRKVWPIFVDLRAELAVFDCRTTSTAQLVASCESGANRTSATVTLTGGSQDYGWECPVWIGGVEAKTSGVVSAGNAWSWELYVAMTQVWATDLFYPLIVAEAGSVGWVEGSSSSSTPLAGYGSPAIYQVSARMDEQYGGLTVWMDRLRRDAAWYPDDPSLLLVATPEAANARGALWAAAGSPYVEILTGGTLAELVTDAPRGVVGVL